MLKRIAVVGLMLACATSVASAQANPCATDAVARAKKLIRLHTDNGFGNDIADGDKATPAAPVRAPKGDGVFDVLEVTSDVYKARYRMRFLYMKGDGCALVGQEIMEIVGARG